jgi:hypothetical protein
LSLWMMLLSLGMILAMSLRWVSATGKMLRTDLFPGCMVGICAGCPLSSVSLVFSSSTRVCEYVKSVSYGVAVKRWDRLVSVCLCFLRFLL